MCWWVRDDQSNIIDVDFLHFLLLEVEVGSVLVRVVLVGVTVTVTFSLLVALHKLDTAATLLRTLCDFQVLWHLALRLQLSDLIREVFQNNIAFLVLELSQGAHDQVTHSYPYFLLHATADVTDSFHLIEAAYQHSSIAEHLEGETIL